MLLPEHPRLWRRHPAHCNLCHSVKCLRVMSRDVLVWQSCLSVTGFSPTHKHLGGRKIRRAKQNKKCKRSNIISDRTVTSLVLSFLSSFLNLSLSPRDPLHPLLLYLWGVVYHSSGVLREMGMLGQDGIRERRKKEFFEISVYFENDEKWSYLNCSGDIINNYEK